MVNSPLPMIIFRPESGDIIWTNDRFLQLTGDKEHLFDAKLETVLPDFDTRWLLEGKSECPDEVKLGERRFLVYGHLVRASERGGGFLATTYWVDVTELANTRDRYQASRPAAAVLLLDNYEDLMKNLTENQRSTIYSEINARLDAWAAGTGGMLRRMERDRYLFLFEQQYLSRFVDQKFDILDTIHQVVSPSGLSATFSIGIGVDGDSFQELLQYANLSIEMALSRGGDQAVIRNKFTFEFFGGRSKETEKRTKVKSRVMANALSALVSDSSCLFIMGHRSPDNDCIGAAAGVFAIARKRGVPAHIIQEPGSPPSKVLTDRLMQLPEYKDCFLSSQEALLLMDNRSLVVVVDTNRPEQVQSQEVLESCNRIAVIDHHRRAATYIEGAALNYHEPYASSASELVTELLQYIADPTDLTRAEAEALLAGIVLDTKNFSMRTGGRTFEAAAFLRRAGADTAEVKKLFQNDLAGTIAKYAIIQNAKLYRDQIAIAVVDHTVGRVTAAQAADELLNIIGTSASTPPSSSTRTGTGSSSRPAPSGTPTCRSSWRSWGAEATPPPPAGRFRARLWTRWPRSWPRPSTSTWRSNAEGRMQECRMISVLWNAKPHILFLCGGAAPGRPPVTEPGDPKGRPYELYFLILLFRIVIRRN